MSTTNTEGTVKLADGTVLKLVVNILEARESGFSPLGGINILVKPIGGATVIKSPSEVMEKIKDKPFFPSGEQPKDGWELVDIIENQPATAEKTIETSKGPYLVKMIADPSMASRNLNYKNELDEPIYFVVWVSKISWKPIVRSE